MKRLIFAFKRIWNLLEPFQKPLIHLSCVLLVLQGVSLLTPYYTGRLIDGLTSHLPKSELMRFAWLIFVAKMAEVLIGLGQYHYHIRYFDHRMKGYLRVETLKRVSRFSIGQIINESSGFRESVLSKGEGAIKDLVDLFFSNIIPTAARGVVTFIGLLYFSPLVCLVVVVGAFIYIAISFVLNQQLRGGIKAYRKLGNKLDTEYSDVLKNMRMVMVNAQEERVIADYREHYEKYNEIAQKLWGDYNTKATLLRDPFSAISLFVTIITCIYAVYDKGYSAGQIVTALSWTFMFWSTLSQIGPYQRRITIWHSLANQYFDMLDIPSEVHVVEHPTRPAKFVGKIEFRNVSFSYPVFTGGKRAIGGEQKGALHDVSFTIEAGTTCALVGHSGSGKSTIINLILRVYDPDNGEIRIDGYDLRILDPKHMRKFFGVVEQDVKLWDGTLRENMLYTVDESMVPLERMEYLAEKAGITGFYDRLGESRFETLVGENGIKLSGGEKQRVGIARALANNPPILIFDEATNSLDTINDAKVQQAMKESLRDRTGIIIAHRLSTIRHADKIIVMNKGRVAGIGRHEDLMVDCPYYKSLVEQEIEALVG